MSYFFTYVVTVDAKRWRFKNAVLVLLLLVITLNLSVTISLRKIGKKAYK